MAFVRDTAPRRGGLRVLESYLERTLERLDDYTRITDARIRELERLRAVVGIRIAYLWDDDTDIGVPVIEGDMKMNSGNAATATQFAISRFDQFGREAIVPGLFDETLDSGIFYVEDYSKAGGQSYAYTITGPATQRATDVVIDVTEHQTTGPSPTAGDLMQASYWPDTIPP